MRYESYNEKVKYVKFRLTQKLCHDKIQSLIVNETYGIPKGKSIHDIS
jgi:hypothetical protein